MEDYSFYHGQLPFDCAVSFEQSLFNQRQHLSLQSVAGYDSFYILLEKQKKAVAAIHFFYSNSVALSPLRAPFGSIEWEEDLTPFLLFQFIEFIESKLRDKNITSIVIKTPPQQYSPGESLLHTFLLNLDYRVTQAEAGAVIPVGEKNLVDIFHRSEKKRLRNAQHAGLQFSEISIGKLAEVYTFIARCRAVKNFKLSLSLEDLQRVVDAFKNKYLLFGIYEQQKLVAASIAIRVKENILYEFYHDHDEAFDHLSPVVLLVEGIYNYCYKHGIKLFDLGTSSIEGKPNFGLLTFKMRLGARPTPKLTFEKILR